MVANLLAAFFLCCTLLLSLALYCTSIRCMRLEKENRILRWFFEQQEHMEADYCEALQAMLREAARAPK